MERAIIQPVIPSVAVLIVATGLFTQDSSPQPGAASRQASRPIPSASCDRTPYDCAALDIERGAFTTAVARLETVLASAPRDPKVRNLLGIALTAAGRVDEGSRQFREALALDPGFAPARKNLAVNEFNSGRLASAERLFNEVLTNARDDDVAHVHLAEIHFARKQPSLALAHYKKSATRVLTNPAWILHYASCLLESGDTAQAARVLDRLPAEDGASQFAAGVALGRAGAHVEAARHFGLARSTHRDRYAAGYNQVLMLVEAADYAGAIRVAEELLQAGASRGELLNLAARAYVGANRIQDAYDALRTAAGLEPNDERHYVDLALICLDHENFDLGLEIVKVGLHHKPGSARLHIYRGVLFVMKGLAEEAAREFEKASALAPEGPVAHVALAMIWMQSGRTSEAVALLRERMRAGARQAIVPYMFGIALLRSGVDPADVAADEAVRAFEEAIRADPRLPGPRTELGKVFLRRGEVRRAVEHLEPAVSLDPDNPAPAYSLAQAYRRLGDTVRAQELLAKVSRLNAQGRGDDPDRELRRLVVRIVRQEGPAPGGGK